jgi:membrane protease YdiL (CAAX protease family)
MEKKTRYGFEIWRLIYPILIYFGIQFFVSFAYMLVAVIGMMAGGLNDPMAAVDGMTQLFIDNTLIITIISNTASFIIFLLLYNGDKNKEKNNCEFFIFENAPMFKWLLLAILAICSALSLNIIIGYTKLAELSPGFDAVSEAIYGSDLWVQILAVVISAPILEEFLVRGLIFKRMKRWSSPLVAAIVSSALFGLIHLNLVQFVYAFLLGMMLALVYEKFENIWAPILFHLVANAVSITISNVPALAEAFESDVVVIISAVVTTIAMVVLVVYFVKSEKVNGKKMECGEMLGSQLEVQEREKEMYS